MISFEDHRRAIVADDEPQLTDDEDNSARDVSPIESDLPDLEQSKKRRRTANYQHIVSTSTATATANGHHQDERTSPPSSTGLTLVCDVLFDVILVSTTSVGSSITRRVLDYGPNTTNTTPVLLQTSTETSQNEGINRFASAKPRFNLPSTHRALPSQYDPSQSPLFSVGSRVSRSPRPNNLMIQRILLRKQRKPPCRQIERLRISNLRFVRDEINFSQLIDASV